MARQFAKASTQYLQITSFSGFTAYPMSFAGWMNMDSLPTAGGRYPCLTLDDESTNHFGFGIDRSGTHDTIMSIGGGNDGQSTGAGAQNTGQWYHVAVVLASATDRRIFMDGGDKGTSTTSQTWFTPTRLVIGDQFIGTVFSPMDGRIAEVAGWDATLTDEEVAALALGYSPQLIQPQNLSFYAPLIRDEDFDKVGGRSLSPVNTPTIGVHPPIIYPAPIQYPHIAPASAGPAYVDRGTGRGIGSGVLRGV